MQDLDGLYTEILHSQTQPTTRKDLWTSYYALQNHKIIPSRGNNTEKSKLLSLSAPTNINSKLTVLGDESDCQIHS